MKTYYVVYASNNGLSLGSSFVETDVDFDSAEGIKTFNQQLSNQLKNFCFLVSYTKVAPLPKEEQTKEPLMGNVATPYEDGEEFTE